MQPTVADLILVVTVKCSSFQVENRIYTNFYSTKRLSQTQEEKQKEKKKKYLLVVFFHIYKSLEDHCQNRSQNVFTPDVDDDDVEER